MSVFRELAEGLTLKVPTRLDDPRTMNSYGWSMSDVREGARVALEALLDRWGTKSRHAAERRYEFHLDGLRDSGWGEVNFKFRLEWKERSKEFKEIESSLDSIPEKSGHVYRGMSTEEWEDIRRRRKIGSAGEFNIQGQNGRTYFGNAARTARGYAGGYAPWTHTPTRSAPGVVIEIPDKEVTRINDYESYREGDIPASVISRAWWIVGVPYPNPGFVEATASRKSDGDWLFKGEGSRMAPSSRTVLIPVKRSEMPR